VLRIKKPEIHRPYKVILYPVLPIIYIVLASTFVICLLIAKPEFTVPGLIIVSLGIPIYFLFNRYSQRQHYENSK